jgi:hypothetical protein
MQRLNDSSFLPLTRGFLACEHLTQLELAVALRQGRRPSYENAYAELLRAKGQEHEQAYLATLREAGRRVVEVGLDAARDFEAGTRRTAEAMRAGADYVPGRLPVTGLARIADFWSSRAAFRAGGFSIRRRIRSFRGIRARARAALLLTRRSSRSSSSRPTWPCCPRHLRLGDPPGRRDGLPRACASAGAAGRPARHGPYPCDHCSFCDYQA